MIKKISVSLVCMMTLAACVPGEIQPDKIKVFKYDSSVSCDQSSGISIATMQQELEEKKVSVINMMCGVDGVVRAAVCGNSTGKVNVFEIKSKELAAARRMGYQPLTALEDFSEIPCP